jgi:hypothetical protein
MRLPLILVLVNFGLLGCASHGTRAAMTSGEIGCPVPEVEISEGNMGWTTNTWVAKCRGKTFYCTYTTSYNLGSRTQCKEELK